VDFGRLASNIATSWRNRAGIADFVRSLLLIYSESLPRIMQKREWTIGFTYPAPIGQVRLLLRANQGADAFIRSEVFEHECYRLPFERSPETILDLGANIGLTAIYLVRTFPSAALACVEPIERNLKILARNLELNDVRATIIPAAVDIDDGYVLMETFPADYDHRIAASRDTQSSLEVPAVSVRTIMRQLNWDRIGLVKMDIEGHEEILLTQNCDWLNRTDAICMEYHHHCAETQLAGIASRFGFLAPQRLPGGIWFLTRQRPAAD
jgi:FkbM family methyltransferase